MNCKVGDLAIIFRGNAFKKYWGQIVKCVHLSNEELCLWSIDRSLDGDLLHWMLVPDSCLRPVSGLSLTENTDDQIKERV